MILLHHVTHAVCIVIISFLLKKHVELRSALSDLQFEYSVLKQACESSLPDSNLARTAGLYGDSCQCPQSFEQSQTSGHMALHKFSESGGQYRSLLDKEIFADILDPSSVPVDEFGRSLDHEADDNSARREIQGHAVTSGFSQSSQFSPLHHQASFMRLQTSSDMDGLEGTSMVESVLAGKEAIGKTETSQTTTVSFRQTQESLESIKLSPSLSSTFGSTKSNAAGDKVDIMEKLVAENDNFYLGSHFAEDNEEEETDVIVTSIDGNINEGFQYKTSEYDHEFEDKEENVAEEVEHPAFGNVKLHWLSDLEKDNLTIQGSSVQCTGINITNRLCQFGNLCVKPETREFVFLLSNRSVQENVPTLKPREALLELSTVAGHNAQHFFYNSIPSITARDMQVASISGTAVIFKRFKPDNIMHILHDDIIPFFHTLLSLKIRAELGVNGENFPVSLFLVDENSEGEFFELYNVFAAYGAFTAESLMASVAKTGALNSLVCFPEAYVGLFKTTTWYQYGFFKPQDPLPNSLIKSHHIHTVSSYLLNSFNSDCPFCSEGGHLVLVSRKETRRILNEMDLVLALTKAFKVRVMTVSLETHDLADIIPIIHSSLGIIGMHGSLLSLAIFLKQGSILVELFPYAVNPDHYTPYKTLCRIPGMFIAYRAWANRDPETSLSHLDWPAEFGGIEHLPLHQQQTIISQVEVPKHLCCSDPSWLFHIFQDTQVNITQVIALTSSAIEEAKPLRTTNKGHSWTVRLPGPVQNLTCTQENFQDHSSLALEWTPPWNENLFLNVEISYSILLQELKTGKTLLTLSAGQVVRFKVTEGIEPDVDYRVWVRCVANGLQGSFAAVELCTAG